MAYLELDRVAKQFGAQTVVDDFSLAVGKGEFISFLGPSGCGKTTTLQMIAGFLDPSRGAIRLEGKDLTAMHPAKRGLGIVFQSYALFPHMTAAENVAFGLEMRQRAARRARRARPRRARDGRARRLRGALSAPHVRRPAAARGARARAGDPAERAAARRAAVQSRRQAARGDADRAAPDPAHLGTTTILVTHDQNEAMSLSDRIVVMSQGRIEQIGTPQETYERPASAFVSQFLGKTNDFAATIDRTARRCGWSPAPGARRRRPGSAVR